MLLLFPNACKMISKFGKSTYYSLLHYLLICDEFKSQSSNDKHLNLSKFSNLHNSIAAFFCILLCDNVNSVILLFGMLFNNLQIVSSFKELLVKFNLCIFKVCK